MQNATITQQFSVCACILFRFLHTIEYFCNTAPLLTTTERCTSTTATAT